MEELYIKILSAKNSLIDIVSIRVLLNENIDVLKAYSEAQYLGDNIMKLINEYIDKYDGR